MNSVIEQLQATKAASADLALISEIERNKVLRALVAQLGKSVADIIRANAKDLAQMDINNPMYDRLLLTEERIHSIVKEIENVIALNSPIGKQIENRAMPNGLVIQRVCVPLGVVAVIYESRPNVTLDVFTLCFKTANACILKGGKEAYFTNQALIDIIQKVLISNNIDMNVACLLSPDRADTNALLQAIGLVDVCIPRGSQALIDFVRNNAKIPIIETGAGIVHAYFDLKGDLGIGQSIINNSKTRRVSVCNALDCLLMHKDRLSDLYALVELLVEHNVQIYADDLAYAALKGSYPAQLLALATQDDFGKEFLDYKLAIKTVDSVDAAIQHIMRYTSGHSEAIISEDVESTQYFAQRVDAAVVYINASTAFTDGAQFGLGAEIGISTQKLHARGPMALDALTSYKWIVHGDGQIRPA